LFRNKNSAVAKISTDLARERTSLSTRWNIDRHQLQRTAIAAAKRMEPGLPADQVISFADWLCALRGFRGSDSIGTA
jgi:hypothetical protein